MDDAKNTDNAWLETTANNYHDEEGDKYGSYTLAEDFTWVEVLLVLLASTEQYPHIFTNLTYILTYIYTNDDRYYHCSSSSIDILSLQLFLYRYYHCSSSSIDIIIVALPL